MGAYLAGCTASFLSTLTIVFAIAVLGYYLGSIHIKGISLGTAGVLLVALLAGILFSFVPSITLGEKTITFFGEGVTSNYSLLSNIGTALFVTAVGLIAGPKFFRSFNRKMLGYIVMGVVIILSATLLCVIFIKVGGVDPNMMAGLLTGALTSTPGLSAANEVATNSEMVTAGYGIAYLFGVIGVVLFVQIMPKLLKVDMDKERKSFNAANDVEVPTLKDGLKKIDAFSFFPFVLAIVLGRLIGAISIPGINFSLGGSGGMLLGKVEKIGDALGVIGEIVDFISGLCTAAIGGPIGIAIYLAIKILTGELDIAAIPDKVKALLDGIAALKALLADSGDILKDLIPEWMYNVIEFFRNPPSMDEILAKVVSFVEEKINGLNWPLPRLLSPVIDFVKAETDKIGRIAKLLTSGDAGSIATGILEILGFAFTSIGAIIDMLKSMWNIFCDVVSECVASGDIFVKYKVIKGGGFLGMWDTKEYHWQFCIPGLCCFSGEGGFDDKLISKGMLWILGNLGLSEQEM